MTNRQYVIGFGMAMLGYVVTLVGSILVIRSADLTGWPAGLVSLTPLVPALFGLKAYVDRFRSLDEFQRRIVSEALLWGAGIVGFAAFGYGFLEGAVEVPQISLIWVMPALVAVSGLVQCVLQWQADR